MRATLRRILRTTAVTLEVGRVSVWRYNEDKTGIRCYELYATELDCFSSGYEIMLADYPDYFAAIESEEVVVADDARTHTATKQFVENYLLPNNIGAMLDAGIYLDGNLEGVICHEHIGNARTWTAEEQVFAVSMAALISSHISSSQRHEAIEALKRSEDRYRTFVANSSEGIWRFECDPPMSTEWSVERQVSHIFDHGFLAECNDRMAQMSGHSDGKMLVGLRVGDFLEREDKGHVAYLKAFIASGYRLSEAMTAQTDAHGFERVFANNLVGLVEKGKLLRAWGTQREVTESFRKDEELRQSEERLRAMNQALTESQNEIIERLAATAEYRDDDTGQHTRRVGLMAWKIALELGLPEEEADLVRRAAYLHDLGKVGIPDAILLKNGKLTNEEFEIIKRHTVVGAEILRHGKTPLLQMSELVARTHHEKWDGRGYPDGLSGEDIPLAGRIVAVADVFDALTTERPYKSAWTVSDAVTEITEQSGRHFDPTVVQAFLSVVHNSVLQAA